ncbi:hypothetical protein BOX15_Mlig010441g2 [Macrostomum lignano]|uniref:Protein kinase domain-containing protein n=1 Tax=Macrostomum lignano TaxID=282301 RepID=A0A267DUR8_9PLAT|nr:hypothetical protein BOX15_Mlig010441g2 [Macrostomum lignano]
MDFIRLSVLPTDLLLQATNEEFKEESETTLPGRRVSNLSTGSNDDATVVHRVCSSRCVEIMPLLINSSFKSKYWTFKTVAMPDCYVFSHRSSRCIILEVVTRFPESQTENLHSYKFSAHPLFEDKVSTYTRWKGKDTPNQNLVRSRTWDVALNVVMKIEAVPAPFNKYRYLLKRESEILQFMWDKYLDSGADIDEMTGIPMLFEYQEVPNDTFYVTTSSNQVDEIDQFGKMKPISFPPASDQRTTLSYMTMEKLGPNLSYLQRLVKAAQAPPYTFDLWTAAKIFDQLICRILQVHKSGVVHNDISPENIYMGNGVAFDVVYLNNYKRSYIVAEGDKKGPSGLASSSIGCNVRFASVGQLSGSVYNMSPIDDIESAFYVLLAMLSGDSLPWDGVLRLKRTSEYSLRGASSNSNARVNNTVTEEQKMQILPTRISNETLRKVMNFKNRFWQSSQLVNLVLSNCHCLFSGDAKQASSVAMFITDLYLRVRDWRQNFKSCDDYYQYSKKLNRSSSEEFRQFMELRKCALVYFEFSETFDILNDITFRKKVDQLKNDSVTQQPWNAFVWCFNNIEITTQSKRSVSFVSSVAQGFRRKSVAPTSR